VLRALFASFDGLEASIVRTLIGDLERGGVETWGLSSSLEDLRACPRRRLERGCAAQLSEIV
jgi:hypothetical protein